MAKKKTPTKSAEPPTAKPTEPLTEKVYAEMRRLNANGIKEVSSRLISDKLGLDKETGRGQVRRAMKKLEADGKVVSAVKEGKKRQFVYRLKE